ncbi:glycosyltransferase family 2 protein [Novosphingobium sp. 1748]|uniref:glycosyltransferase family 2 protein n=1 Tax=Novosphingobium sp. 1748 TaxID=2817760 RepID=UPI00286B1F96|nr:glycosyltransferase family 2 protein [Novosphingobium sp. 1748]
MRRLWLGLRDRLWGAGLRCALYCHGFYLAPGSFLTATKWRLLGKKVRARRQMTALLGLSPLAYPLWFRQQAKLASAVGFERVEPPIIALIDDAANLPEQTLRQTLSSLTAQGITAHIIPAQAGPALAALAEAVDWAAQPWVMPIQAGDQIAPGTVEAYRATIAAGPGRVVFADDDLITASGRHQAPHFKPDWNAPLFEHFDYLTGACAIKVGPHDLAAVSGEADWAGALLRRVLAVDPHPPRHIHRPLHHRRTRRAAQVPVAAPLEAVNALPMVSVIVPTRNRLDLLRTCLAGLAATRYPEMEVLVVDNDSDDPATLAYLAELAGERIRVLRHHGPFNYSAINNRAVEQARGDLICLLNNDIEILEPDWLARMACIAMRPDVGAVGARLLYPDGRIQHAGVVIGMGNAAGHAHRFVLPEETGYFHRHNLPQFASAVTAACLVVRRDRFMAAGMLDEIHFPVAFNDVDLCLRLNERGWQSFYEPRATLIHHESVSRGDDSDPVSAARFAGELAALKRLWGTETCVDPFHHPQLSRVSEGFTIAL